MTSTTDSDESELLLKADRMGRVHMPAARREQILDRFESSGMSGQAFAAQIGVKYTTFSSWVQKRRRARGSYANGECRSVKAPLALVEAIVENEPSDPSCGLELETASGLKLRLSGSGDISAAVQLLKALRDAEL